MKVRHDSSLLEGALAQFDPEAQQIIYNADVGLVKSALKVA